MQKSPLPLCNTKNGNKLLYGQDSLVKLLRWHFGYSEFRGKQLEAIQAVLSGRDCFCLMPTGGGKSMCYQIPAMAKPGIVLVVCPLIALMENQVAALKDKGIAAEFLSSTQILSTKNKIHEDLESGKPSLKLLYVTPELISTPGFMSRLKKIYARGLLNLVAIDEAHCISAWGHNFRPAYRKLSALRNHLADVPLLALTATAVPKVQKDVIESLQLQKPLVLVSSFNRPNIYYEVRYKDLLDDAYADLCNVLKSNGDVCGIVYCLERSMCDSLSAHLSKSGISCAAYHAGLDNKMRSFVLDGWISSKIQVVVATVAFGMGIDRKNVRIVCHFNIPKSMEAFYQESGRAGRDQLPSKSLLYYGMDDRRRMEFILRNAGTNKSDSFESRKESLVRSLSDFNQMVEYCEGSGCRRKKILESFGEEASPSICKRSCDACRHPNVVVKNLEELMTTCTFQKIRDSSRIFISSCTDSIDEVRLSEFLNRNDETSDDEEDISDSDDASVVFKRIAGSKFRPNLEMDSKIELLQLAEETYYKNNKSEKQTRNVHKYTISETVREGSRQRLQNALKQTQQRLDNLEIEVETSAYFLEDECYKKYGKSGKSFYYSQVASTVRWLSTTNYSELKNRLRFNTPSPSVESLSEREELPTLLPSGETETEEVECSIKSEKPLSSSFASASLCTKLPPIPSFSDFVNRGKDKVNRSDTPQKHTPNRAERSHKKMRLE